MTSIDAVLARLDEIIAGAMDDRDPCGYFAVLYRRVTAKVLEGLDTGFFVEEVRMERLDTLFAERFFDAAVAHEAGEPATASWQLTFEAASRWRPLVLQHLLVGTAAADWDAAIDDRDRRVARVGERVLHPGPLMSTGVQLARLREQGDVRANLQLLLATPTPSLDAIEQDLDDPTT